MCLDLVTERGDAGERHAVIDELIIDLIRDDIQVVLDADIGDSLERLFRIDSAGRVGGVIENDGLRLVRDGVLELLRRELEALLLTDIDDHRHTAEQAHHLIIADPVRGRDDDFVARVDQSGQRNVDHMLGATGDNCLRGLVFQTVIRLGAVTDRLTQLDHAGRRGVARLSVADRAHTGIADAVGRGKIGFTGAKADDVFSFCFHLLGQCADGQRRRRAHAGSNFGKCLHKHPSFSLEFLPIVYHSIVKKTTQTLHKTPTGIHVIFAGLRKNLLHRPPIYTKTQRLHVVGAAALRDTADNDDDLWLCADGCTHHSDHLSIFLRAVLLHRPLTESPIFRGTGWNFALFCHSIRNLNTTSTMIKIFCSIVTQISVFH